MSEPELAMIGGDLSHPSSALISPDSGYQTLPTRGKPGIYGVDLKSTVCVAAFLL